MICFSPPDIPDHHGNGLYNSSNEFHRLPSVTVHQIDSTNEPDGSFEDEDTDIDQTDSQCQGNYITAHVLYDFDGKRSKNQSRL